MYLLRFTTPISEKSEFERMGIVEGKRVRITFFIQFRFVKSELKLTVRGRTKRK